jgi:protein ImuA
MSRDGKHAVLAELRDAIRRIERRPARRAGFVPCGLAAVDAALPAGGFPRGAVTELAGGPASGKTAVALALFAALGTEDLMAFVDGREELYPPAAAARGVDLGRLLVIRPARKARGGVAADRHPALAALWAAEALLGSGAFAAVAMDVPLPRDLRGADAALRRLQAAAEKGGAIGLWLAPAKVAVRAPAAVRLVLDSDGERIAVRRTIGGEPAPDANSAERPGSERAASPIRPSSGEDRVA